MSKRAGAPVRREHRILERIGRILGTVGGQLGKPVQPSMMTVEQLLERVAVACDMRGQQFGVAVFLPTLVPKAHGWTVTNRSMPGTSPDPVSAVGSVQSGET